MGFRGILNFRKFKVALNPTRGGLEVFETVMQTTGFPSSIFDSAYVLNIELHGKVTDS